MFKTNDDVLVFAHRGASGHAFENTFTAFNKAVELGSNGIEIDLQLSKEGTAVVIHDLYLNRLVGINRRIDECQVDEILQFKLGKPYRRLFSKLRIPLFADVVEWANQHQVPLNVEIKESYLNNKPSLIQLLDNLQLPAGSHFSSFHLDLLNVIKQYAPKFEVALIATRSLNWEQLSSLQFIDTIHASKKYYKLKNLDACMAAGKKLRIYGVNGSESYLVNPHEVIVGWITDYPDKVIRMQKRDVLR